MCACVRLQSPCRHSGPKHDCRTVARMPAWCVYSEPRNAKNIAERLQCKVVHGIATGRSHFNRKLMEIGENLQKGNSVHSGNAQAAAKRKIIQVVHVTCVSLPVCSAEAPARPMPWPRRTQKQVPGEFVRVCQAHALATLRTEDGTTACSRLQLRKCGQTLRKAQRVTTQGRLPLAPGQACCQ